MYGGTAVYVDVLPSMSKFGPSLTKGLVSQSSSAGNAAGRALDSNIASSASRGGRSLAFFGGVAKAGVKATAVIAGGVGAIGGAIAGVAAKKGLDRLLDIDSAQQKLKGLKMTEADITKVMSSALDSVRGTAFGLGEAATVASSAVAAGVKPGADLTKYLKLTADAASIAGTSLGEMGSIINQTTTSGKVYTDSLNQLSDRGIPIFQWLQKEYHVSADDLSEMVKKGEVDATTFRKVIQENIGGAALSSGDSVRGAWANVGAAAGRLGAMFLKGGIAAAPPLLTSVMNAADRLGVALTPVADSLNGKVSAGFAKVAGWVDHIDFQKAVDGLGGLYALVVQGDFSGKLASAFGIQEDSKFVDFVLSGRDAVVQLFTAVKSGDMDGLGTGLGSVVTAAKPLAPVLWGVVKGLGSVAGAAGDVLGNAIPLVVPILKSFSDILGWLGNHSELLTPIILGLAAGFLVYKSAQAAANTATAAGLPLTVLRIAADIARTVALERNTRAMIANRGIENASAVQRVIATGTINWATVATRRNTQALGQQATAATGATLATRIQTAATFLGAGALRVFGAAVRFAMGPIGIAIAIVAALAAGLVWFFTQTKVGQGIVQAVFTALKVGVQAVGTAFTWLYTNAIQPAFAGIATAATWVWSTILKPAFDGIVVAAKVVGAAGLWLWQTILEPAFRGIGAVVGWWWNTTSAIFDLVVAMVKFGLGVVFGWLWTSVIQPVFGWIGAKIASWWTGAQAVFGFAVAGVRLLGAGFSWFWTNVVSPVFGWIGAKISAWWGMTKIVFGAVTGYLRATFGPAFTWLYENAIKPAWDKIKAAVKVVWDWAKPIFDKWVNYAKVVIPAAFEVMRKGIAGAWQAVQDGVKAPIRFVVNTVINDALIGNFNRVADAFGTKHITPIRLPKGFSRGGVLDGYQSAKRDEVLTPMRKGEGVLVPEVVRALGPGFVHGLNRAGNTGGVSGVRKAAGYATGGVVGAGKNILSGAMDWVKNAADTAANVVSDPMGTIGAVVKSVLGRIPGAGRMVEMAGGFGRKVLDGAVSALQKVLGSFGAATGGGPNGRYPAGALAPASGYHPGSGVGAMGGMLRTVAAQAWNVMRAASGNQLTLTEGYRDLASQQYRWAQYKSGRGNLAAAPGTSVHGYGLAADIGSGQGWARANGPRFGWYPTGLSFAQREPWHFEYKGARAGGGMAEGGIADAASLYDSGGMLQRGVHMYAKKTKEPEFALPEGRLVDIVRQASGGSGEDGRMFRDLVWHDESGKGGDEALRELASTLRAAKRGGPR